MTAVSRVTGDLQCIDLEFGGQPGVIASYLLHVEDETALIEIGPTSTLPTLLAGLEQANVDPAEISHILVTHIHLDHAGAAGTFMRRFPRARLYVHALGAPHMVDPSKLLASAERIYGDQMGPLWGTFEPVPADRITTVAHGDAVTVGGRDIEVHYTPGHASHHVTYYETGEEVLFTGDLGAIRLPGFQYVRPATPPPDLDIELWIESIHHMTALGPRLMCATHFGPFDDPARHFDATEANLRTWTRLVEEGLSRGDTPDEIKAAIRQQGEAEVRAESNDADDVLRYELAGPSWMSVDGFLRYFRKRQTSASR